jgi:biopolymer transport protein ExbD
MTLSIALALTACGQAQEEEAPVDTTPIVGALEIAIARNNQAPAPTGAALIEISPSELRLDHRQVVALESGGRVPDAQVAENVITPLRAGLTTGAARPRAAIWVNASVPYLTLLRVLNTLHASNMREVSFAVRRGTTTGGDTGWMRIARWHVVPAGDAPVTFASPARPWSDFVDHWREMYASCRESTVYIDCDGTPRNIAQGGELQVNLWARGQAMKVTFMQVNAGAEAAEGEAPAANTGPALIEGVRAAPPPAEVDLGPIVTEGAFNFRHQDLVLPESAFSNTVQPVCGTESCQVVIDADATTPSMRVLTMLGAFYANGFTEPEIAFRIPEVR